MIAKLHCVACHLGMDDERYRSCAKRASSEQRRRGASLLGLKCQGQPREKQGDQSDASERKLIGTIEQDNAKRAVSAANAGTRMARSTSNVSSGFVGSVRAALHVIDEGSQLRHHLMAAGPA